MIVPKMSFRTKQADRVTDRQTDGRTDGGTDGTLSVRKNIPRCSGNQIREYTDVRY